MKPKKKNKKSAYPGRMEKGSTEKKVKVRRPRKPLAPFEKFLLAMFGISIVVGAASFFTKLEALSYITIANYVILGLIILIRPDLVIQILTKNTEEFDEVYEKKVRVLNVGLRVGGVMFLVIAYILLYGSGLLPESLKF